MLIGNFTNAEALLKQGLKKWKTFFAVAPSVLIHPLETIEGGLTQIEERALYELALGSGARRVVVWTGVPLNDQEVIEKLGK
jgi:hypothetical protein